MQSDRLVATTAALKPPESPVSNAGSVASATGPTAGFQTAKPRSASRFKLPPGRGGDPSSLASRRPQTPIQVFPPSGQARPRFATPQTSQAISRSRSNSITSTSSSVGGVWSKEIDTTSGKVYYFHAEKGITQWEAPVGFDVPSVKKVQNAPEIDIIPPVVASVGSDEGSAARDVPVPQKSSNNADEVQIWQQLTDPSSGDIYYYNSATGETQWERPSSMDSHEQESPGVSDCTPETFIQPTASVQVTVQDDIPEEQYDAPNDQNHTPEDAHPKVMAQTMQSSDKLNPNDADEASSGLPTGWRCVTDADNGTYYFNEVSGETSWEVPGATNSPRAEEESELPVEGHLPDNWKQIVDPSSGTFYFFNEETGETSWEIPTQGEGDQALPEKVSVKDNRPRDEESDTGDGSPSENEAFPASDDKRLVVEDEDQSNEALPPNWIKVEDPATAKVYYYNEVTGSTSWTIPLETLVDQEAVETCRVEDETNQSLPHGWSKNVDPATGQVFYFNETSGESSWNAPVLVTGSSEIESPVLQSCNEARHIGGGLLNDGPDKQLVSELQSESQAVESKIDQVSIPEGSKNDRCSYELDSLTNTDLALSKEHLDDGPTLLTELETDISHNATDTSSDYWKRQTDESTGDYYYVNVITGETTWDPPGAMKNVVDVFDNSEEQEIEYLSVRKENEDNIIRTAIDAQNESSNLKEVSDPKSSVPSLPTGWQLLYDPVSGDPYYYNERLNETSWEPPFTIPEANTSIAVVDAVELSGDSFQRQSDLPDDECKANGGWITVQDPSSGDVYFYNQQTGQTSWELPTSKDEKLREDADQSPHEHKDVFVDSTSATVPAHLPELSSDINPNEGIGCSVSNDDQEQKEQEAINTGVYFEAGTPGHADSSSLGVNDEQNAKAQEIVAFENAKAKYTSTEKSNLPTLQRNREEDLIQNENHHTNGRTESNRDPSPTLASKASELEAASTEISQADAVASSQPSYGWEQVVDEASGDVYYLNQQTGETSWDPPALPVPSIDCSGSLGGQLPEPVPSSCSNDENLPLEWEMLVDPTSGRPYYFNKVKNTTSWEPPCSVSDDWIEVAHPSGHSEPAKVAARSSDTAKNTHVVGRRGSFACFGFGGHLCVSCVPQGHIVIHKTSSLIPSHMIVEAETAKREACFSGPLVSAEIEKVLVYLERKAKKQSDLIWSLCLIASQSKGRLRSDDRVNASAGPEPAIVDLLLSNTHESELHSAKLIEDHHVLNGSGLDEIQLLLLKGEREEAVERALVNGHYALALLVASMCNREIYFKAAKSYTDSVLCKGSPLHTVAELYCSQLQTAEVGGVDPMMWNRENVNLRQTWRKHLAAIISNRTAGWDLLAVSLGDRLKNIGEVIPAHVCYMVCGCSLSPPARKDAKMSLLGCDASLSDLVLMTDDSVESFCRAEAYEWAKRRGNKNAAIQSIQGFKLQYALLLSDVGMVEEAKMYIASIKDCLGFKEGFDLKQRSRHPAFVSVLTADRMGILQHATELESRLNRSFAQMIKLWDSSCQDSPDVTQNNPLVSARGGCVERESYRNVRDETRKKSSPPAIIGNPEKVSKEQVPAKQAPLPSINVNNVATGPKAITEKEAMGQSKPPIINTPVRTAASHPDPSAQATKVDNKKKPQPEQAPRSAPPNLQSPSFGFMNKLKDRLIKWQNPDAHIANPGEEMQAYYDKERKVWVFPGEDPDELAKPVGPPPSMSTPVAAPSVAQQNNDPLAAMMAPPQRAPSALRGRPSSTPSPGSLPPYTPLPGSISASQSPPQFMVFQPVAKPDTKNKEGENS